MQIEDDPYIQAEQALWEGRHLDALKLFSTVAENEPAKGRAGCVRAAVQLNMRERAQQELALCMEQGESHWSHLAQAHVYILQERWTEVLTKLKQARRGLYTLAVHREIWEYLCLAYQESDQYDRAFQMFDALQQTPAEYLRTKAHCAGYSGDPQEELRCFDQLLHEEGWAGWFVAKAEVQIDLGDLEKARPYLAQAISEADHAVAKSASELLGKMEDGLPVTKSYQDFLSEGAVHRALRKLGPAEQIPVLLERGMPYRAVLVADSLAFDLSREERFVEAIPILESVVEAAFSLELERTVLMSMCRLATLQVEHGEPARGLELFRKLLLSPNRRAMAAELDRLVHRDGSRPELRELLEEALEPQPDPPVPQERLFDPATGVIPGVSLEPGERFQGPGGVWLQVDSVDPPEQGREGKNVKLIVLDPYPMHPANDTWAEAWFGAQGLSQGPYKWGSLHYFYWQHPIIHLDYTRPIPQSLEESLDLESGRVHFRHGWHYSQQRLVLDSGVAFMVGKSDESEEFEVYRLDLYSPVFYSGPSIKGQALRIPCNPGFMREAALRDEEERKKWLTEWLKTELKVEPGQRFPWGVLELGLVTRYSTGIILRHQPPQGLWGRLRAKFINKNRTPGAT